MGHELFQITDETRGALLCDRAWIAETLVTRLVGLLGRDRLEPGEGLLIMPSSGVHTWGMVFSIDVVALDKHLRVLSIDENVRPWRIGGLSLSTRSILELPAGQSRRLQVARGDQLHLAPATLLAKD